MFVSGIGITWVIYLGIDTVFGIDQARQKQVNIFFFGGGGGEGLEIFQVATPEYFKNQIFVLTNIMTIDDKSLCLINSELIGGP